MESLSPECTPLKYKYDTCFNLWFEGYLQPAIASSSSAPAQAAPISPSAPSASSSSAPAASPSATSPHTHKERLFSLVPYDPAFEDPEDPTPELELPDDEDYTPLPPPDPEDLEGEVPEEEAPREHIDPGRAMSVQDRARQKAEEYERNCGAAWREYRACLQRSIDDNEPLKTLLEQARQENPLERAEPLDGGGFGAPGAEP